MKHLQVQEDTRVGRKTTTNHPLPQRTVPGEGWKHYSGDHVPLRHRFPFKHTYTHDNGSLSRHMESTDRSQDPSVRY